MGIEQGRFIASKDVVDRIKLENSVISSEMATMTPQIVAKVISIVANTYYSYIPIDSLERLKELPDRVVATDASGFDALNIDGRQNIDEFFTPRGN